MDNFQYNIMKSVLSNSASPLTQEAANTFAEYFSNTVTGRYGKPKLLGTSGAIRLMTKVLRAKIISQDLKHTEAISRFLVLMRTTYG